MRTRTAVPRRATGNGADKAGIMGTELRTHFTRPRAWAQDGRLRQKKMTARRLIATDTDIMVLSTFSDSVYTSV